MGGFSVCLREVFPSHGLQKGAWIKVWFHPSSSVACFRGAIAINRKALRSTGPRKHGTRFVTSPSLFLNQAQKNCGQRPPRLTEAFTDRFFSRPQLYSAQT